MNDWVLTSPMSEPRKKLVLSPAGELTIYGDKGAVKMTLSGWFEMGWQSTQRIKVENDQTAFANDIAMADLKEQNRTLVNRIRDLTAVVKIKDESEQKQLRRAEAAEEQRNNLQKTLIAVCDHRDQLIKAVSSALDTINR